MEDLQEEFFIENYSINVQFPKQTGEITAGEITGEITYLLSIAEIKDSVQQIGADLLLIINNYMIQHYIYLILIIKKRIATYRVLAQQFF